jgi:hypothetical protein
MWWWWCVGVMRAALKPAIRAFFDIEEPAPADDGSGAEGTAAAAAAAAAAALDFECGVCSDERCGCGEHERFLLRKMSAS